MNFDERQLKAIETTGADILVSASAGSGKTTVMIERILRLIEGGADLKRMLIVTFTKAAAADMRAKLFRALCERSENESCRRALKTLANADISTLHSFCARLVRKYFYAADVDPAFELLGDGDSALLERCLDMAVENAASVGAEELYEIMLSSRSDRAFRAAVRRVYDVAVGMPDPRGWLENCLRYYADDSEARKEVEAALEREKIKLVAAVDDCRLRCEQAGFTRNLNSMEELIAALEHTNPSVITPSRRGKTEWQYAQLNDEFKYLKDEVKKHLKRCAECAALCPSGKSYEYAHALRDCAAMLLDIYSKEKEKKAAVDYNDLEHYAYDVLRSEHGDEIRKKYDYVFVDEYQDINPLQDAIIGLVRCENNLFLVGDLKQSIYAFRGCDPSIFAAKSAAFSSGGGVNVELNRNFRTCPEIIENVNRVFSKCMTSDFGGVNYEKSARLVAARTEKGNFRYVNILTPQREAAALADVYRLSEHDESAYGSADAESEFIVENILTLLNDGYDNKNVDPADIAVLTRSRSELSYLIRDKLKAAGVPAYVKEDSSAHSPETAPLVAVLRLTQNACDDIALCAALVSYVGGLTSNDLAAIAESMGTDETFCGAARRSEKAAAFFERLERYTALAQSVSAGELLALVALESDAFTEAEKLPNGEERHSALSALLASCGDLTAAEFLEKLDGGQESGGGAYEGCLKIMTVHMSKGLEFEHVFLAGVNRRFNRRDFAVPYFVDRKWGLAVKYPDPADREWKPTFLTEAVKSGLDHRTLEEEMRIMYVALTRAKRTLTVSGTDIKDSDEFKRRLSRPGCPADFLYALRPANIAGKEETEEIEVRSAERVFPGGEGEEADELARLINFECPVKKRAAKTSVTAAVRLSVEDEEYYSGTSEYRGDEDAAERGTAFHLFMQRLDFDMPFEVQRVSFEAEFPESASLVDFEKARVAALLVKGVVGGRKLYREKEFIYDDGGTLVQGVIDLLAVGESGAIVIDYKTGAHVKRKSYAAQLELYSRAVENILGIKVESRLICALDLGEIFDADGQ